MPDTLQIAGGERNKMSRLPDRSLGYCTDTQELWIGAQSGNVLLADASTAQRLTVLEAAVGVLQEAITSLEARVAALEGGTIIV